MLAIMSGKRPPRPTHPSFTGGLWILMQRCWDQNPESRPEASEVVKALGGREYSRSTEQQEGPSSERQTDQAVNQVYGYPGGAVKSRASLRGKNPSRSGEDSRESSDRGLDLAVADTGVGSDLDHDVENGDEGRHQSRVRRDDRRPSRMLFALILPYPTPDIGGDSVLNAGAGYNQSGPSRNPPRMFLRLVIVWGLTTPRTGADLLNNPSLDYLVQRDHPSVYIFPIPLGLSSERTGTDRDECVRGGQVRFSPLTLESG